MDIHSSVNICYKVLHAAKCTSSNINPYKHIAESLCIRWPCHFSLNCAITYLKSNCFPSNAAFLFCFFFIISKMSFSELLSILTLTSKLEELTLNYRPLTRDENIQRNPSQMYHVSIYFFKKKSLLTTGIVILGVEEWNYIIKIWWYNFQAVYSDAKYTVRYFIANQVKNKAHSVIKIITMCRYR